MADANIIELKDATKAFSRIPAFKNVNLDLRKGEIHALLGENGAGKSTLTKVMAGVFKLTEGKLFFDGKE
ncbi:ATP-binding cassette domain-containing protein, partial [Mesorhizobium sp. M4B.F.Ca.ET.049.02.1.2]